MQTFRKLQPHIANQGQRHENGQDTAKTQRLPLCTRPLFIFKHIFELKNLLQQLLRSDPAAPPRPHCIAALQCMILFGVWPHMTLIFSIDLMKSLQMLPGSQTSHSPIPIIRANRGRLCADCRHSLRWPRYGGRRREESREDDVVKWTL